MRNKQFQHDSPAIYCMPGMATDYRIFQQLAIGPLHFMHWLQPEKDESLIHYTKRIAQQIQHPDPILIGVSFGGIISQEIARLLPVKSLILISTIKYGREKPFFFDVLKHIPLYRLTRGDWRIKLLPYVAPLAGFTDQKEVKLFQSMLSRFDDDYRMWCISQICNWESDTLPVPTYHIHGTRDQIFSYGKIENPITIEGGDHFMVLRKGKILSKEILDILQADSRSRFTIVN